MPTNQNTRTLIATFKDYTQAQQAIRDLMNQGIPSDAIRIDSERKVAGAGSGGGTANQEKHESGFSRWWHELFGESHDREERENWERDISNGSSLLSVTVPVDREDTFVELLNRDGAIALDRSSSSATASGTTPAGQPVPRIAAMARHQFL